MATIAERISRTIPNVRDDLRDKFRSDPSWTDIRDHALDRAKRDLYRRHGLDIQTEPEMDELVKDWLADKACAYVLETAIDHYKSLALADTIDDHNRQFYDKVATCESRRRALLDRADDNLLDVVDIVVTADTGPAAIPHVSSRGDYKVTQDPFIRARPWR